MLTSVAAICDGTSKNLNTLSVAGTYEATGLSTIEKWVVTYGSGLTATSVQRVVLFQGSNLGFIRSIAVDHDMQRMFILTHNSEVYRLASLAGALASPVRVYDAVSLPALVDANGLTYGDHASGGPKWIVSATGASHAILLNDPDDDGVIDSTTNLTSTQWKNGGYQSEDAWNEPCID